MMYQKDNKRRSNMSLLIALLLFSSALSFAQKPAEDVLETPYNNFGEVPAIEFIANPTATVPIPQGETYKATVPDTCDLSERIRLYVENYLPKITVPTVNFEPYSRMYFDVTPQRARLDFGSYLCAWAKFRESLPLARIMTGSKKAQRIDHSWAAHVLKRIGPDGLVYVPRSGRPWDAIMPGSYEEFFHGRNLHHYAYLPTGNGRLLDTLAIYYGMTGDEKWNQVAKGIVDRMNELAIDVGDEAFFYRFLLAPDEKSSKKEIEQAISGMYNPTIQETFGNKPLFQTWIIIGLAKYYDVSNYEPARELAQKLTNYMLKTEYVENWGSHFHCISLGIDAELELAQVTGDKKLVELARKEYEVAKSGERSIAIPELGYFVNSRDDETMEDCTIGDMTAIAVKLARLADDKYWEDVDRYVRNALIEGQFTRSDLIQNYFDKMTEEGKAPKTPHGFYHLTDGLSEAMVGAWASNVELNDKFGANMLVTCCTGNCSRAMFYAWDGILDYDDDTLTVNLLLNRASKWADIDSYVPYIGRVDFKVKQDLDELRVRMNDWIPREEIECLADGEEKPFSWSGDYVVVDSPKSGQTVSFRFPIEERTVELESYGHKITATFKGNDCVDVTPEGEHYPMYQRSHYRVNEPQFKEVTRFVYDGPKVPFAGLGD